MWRRAWRDKILPAVVRFRPDLVLVSAGFDAHRKDDMNFRYIGIQERDYEWLTDQIVQARATRAPLRGEGRSGCRMFGAGCRGSGVMPVGVQPVLTCQAVRDLLRPQRGVAFAECA
jgi:hypothetical protein